MLPFKGGSPSGPRDRISHIFMLPCHPGSWPVHAALASPVLRVCPLSSILPQLRWRPATWAALSLPCVIKMQEAPLSKKMWRGPNRSQPSWLSSHGCWLPSSDPGRESGMREQRPEWITSQLQTPGAVLRLGRRRCEWRGMGSSALTPQASVSSSARWGR